MLDDSPQKHLITISEIKNIYINSENQGNMIENLKMKFNKTIIEEKSREFVDGVEHDYAKP